MLKIEELRETELKDYILENLNDCRIKEGLVNNAKYHHTIGYNNVPKALKYGLLSHEERAKLNNRQLTREELNRYLDDGCVNGSDCVSISTPDIDLSQLYRDEFVYDFSVPYAVDIVISSDIIARRNTINYANEYLVNNKISPNDFRAVDIRILNYLKEALNSELTPIEKVIENYNALSAIAQALITEKFNIPFREMSDENITLDPSKVIKLNQIALKK